MDEEKERLQLENLRLEKKERIANIVSALIVSASAIATAIAEWFK